VEFFIGVQLFPDKFSLNDDDDDVDDDDDDDDDDHDIK